MRPARIGQAVYAYADDIRFLLRDLPSVQCVTSIAVALGENTDKPMMQPGVILMVRMQCRHHRPLQPVIHLPDGDTLAKGTAQDQSNFGTTSILCE